MFKIPLEKFDIVLQGFNESLKEVTNYYELKELFADYIEVLNGLKKGDRINFSRFTDHMIDYIFVGRDGKKIIFAVCE